jgi:hypothetical protein
MWKFYPFNHLKGCIVQTDNAQFAICTDHNPKLTTFSKCVAATLYRDVVMFIAEEHDEYTVIKRIDVDYAKRRFTEKQKKWGRSKSVDQVVKRWKFPANEIANMIVVPRGSTGNLMIIMITKRGRLVQVPVECVSKERYPRASIFIRK